MRNNLYLTVILIFIGFIGCKKTEHTPVPPPEPPKSLPVVRTDDVSGLSHFSVTLNGQLIDSLGSPISETGILIDTVTSPTTAKNLNKFVIAKASDGKFSINVTFLPSTTTLYVKAYAISAKGTGYGNEIKFTTLKNKVFTGQVTLSSQQEVNDFGANHYTTIDGDLRITGNITDLSPLLGLAVVNNGVNIVYTPLKNFTGLDSLEATGVIFPNDFWVEYNNNIVDFTGLSKLKTTRGSVQIDHNNSLTSLDGLNSYIAASAGEMRIGENDKLKNLNGLRKMTFVGDDLLIINNPALSDITGLSNLTDLYGRLSFINCPSLTNLNGLEKIKTLPGGVELTNDPLLSDVSGLRNFSSIDGTFGVATVTITQCPAITDLSAFGNLTVLDYLELTNNSHLKDLKGFKNLKTINYTLHIENDSVLTDLSGLENLSYLPRLDIISNSSLINLNGLTGLTKIVNNAYSITVARNNKLQSLIGLQNIVQADGSVQISFNPALTEFCALKPLFTRGYTKFFLTEGNASNPTQTDILTKCP